MPQPGNPQTFNRYAYVRNSPLTRSDAYLAGRLVGDLAATAQGIYEILDGGGKIVAGGGCLLLTGGGCAPVTLLAAGAGAVEFVHGVSVASTGISDATNVLAKRGSSNCPRPSNREIAERIANGHAYDDHVDMLKEFEGMGINSRTSFADFIKGIIDDATGGDIKRLDRGRIAYWDDATDTIVVYDPNHPDWGTAYWAQDGRDAFDGLR